MTITGTDFTGATAVDFGATAATDVHRRLGHPDHRHLAGRAGGHGRRHRHHPGGGTSATSAADQFTYVAAPTVTAVSPDQRADRRRHRR